MLSIIFQNRVEIRSLINKTFLYSCIYFITLLIYTVIIEVLFSKLNMENYEIQNNQFDPFQSRFMCCFGYYHVKRGAKILGFVRLIFITPFVLLYIGEQLEFDKYHAACSFFAIMICIVLYFGGIYKEDNEYLIPYLTLEV